MRAYYRFGEVECFSVFSVFFVADGGFVLKFREKLGWFGFGSGL